jgi:hypothetical protein
MPAELWRRVAQVGKETVAGTPVVATRRMYVRDLNMNNGRPTNFKRFDVRRRDNQLAATQGPDQPEGSGTVDVSADELMEWLETAFGAPTTTTPGGATTARQHVYKPSTTVPTMTVEFDDAANVNRMSGVRVNTLEFSGDASGEMSVAVGLFGQGFTDSFGSLAALTDRVPTFLDAWQTTFAVAALGGTPAVVADTLISWRVNVNNALSRVYTANNTQSATAINFGELDVSGNISLLASSAGAAAEMAAWAANTPRLLQIEHLGPANGIETGHRRTVRITVPVAFEAPDRGQESQGSRAYQLPFRYLYGAAEGYGIQVTLINSRTASF